MTELADLFGKSGTGTSPFRTARVIAVNGRTLTVDFGSGAAGTVIEAVASCNPRPDDNVFIAMDGNRPLALGVRNDPYRQAVLIAVSDSTNTVTGVLNGVSTAVTKAGAFTATPGDTLPLHWAADGSSVWVLAKAGAAYTPPSSGGGGSGGGSAPGSYTTSYAASQSGAFNSSGREYLGDLQLLPGGFGFYGYGTNRFNDLQGKTILSGRVYLPRVDGSGDVTVSVSRGGFEQPGSNSIATGGWGTLPITRLNSLISGSGSAALFFRGSGILKGIPAGTVQITWA